MADSRCPEPKPVTILLLAVAGAAGKVLSGFSFHLVEFGSLSLTYPDPLREAFLGACLGVATGTAISVSRRFWITMLASPILGSSAWFVFFAMWYGSPTPTLDFGTIKVALVYGAAPVVAFSFCHGVYLRWGTEKKLFPVTLSAYLCLGAVSASLEVAPTASFIAHARLLISFEAVYLPGGAILGLLQCLGVLAALAVDRRMRPRLEPPPAAPSPGPGP